MSGLRACWLLAALGWLAGCATVQKDVGLFRMVERTERGELKAYPSASVVDIDVNSSVDIELRRQSFPEVIPNESVKRLLQDMEELAGLQKQLNTIGQRALKMAQLVAQRSDEKKTLTAQESEALGAAFSKQEDFLKKLRVYAERTKAAGGPGLADPGGIDLSIPRQYLASEYSRLVAQSQQYGYKLELVAWKGAEQLHVESYDAIPTGPAILNDKTQPVFGSQFMGEYDAAKKLAASANDLNALREQALQLIRDRLVQVKENLTRLFSQTERATQVASGLGAGLSDEQKKALEEAKTAIKSCNELGTSLKASVDAAVTPPGDDAALALKSLVTQLTVSHDKATACFSNVKAALDNPQLPEVLKPALKPVQELVEAIVSIVAVAPPAQQPVMVTTPVLLSSAPDTSVSLLTVKREEGEVVSIRARVVDGNMVLAETTKHLRVRARGLVADTGAVVLWTREINHAGARAPFSTAAGAYAVVRFKGWRDGCQKYDESGKECLEADAGSPFFQLLAPGIGLAAAVIPKVNGSGSTDIAWMATGHLFGDVLQANIGITTGGTPVWGFGIGLHRVAGIGRYFP